MTSTTRNDNKKINKPLYSINHKTVPPIPLADNNKRKSTYIIRFSKPTTNKTLPSNRSTLYRHNNSCPFKRIQAFQVNKIQWKYISLHQPILTVILKKSILNISIHRIIPTQYYPSIVV